MAAKSQGRRVTEVRDDPRLMLGIGLVLILAVSQVQSLAVALLALVAVAGGALVAGSHWHRLWHVEAFMALLFLSLPFSVPGAALVTIGPLTASAEGVVLAARIAAKGTAAVILAQATFGRVEPSRFGPALRSIHLPEALVRLFLMTLRYIFVIRDEAGRMQDAMRARAFCAGSNRHSWRSFGNLAGMLILRALDRAGRVEEAMLCRGNAGRFPAVTLPPLGGAGRLWLGLAVALALGLTVVDRTWGVA